MRCTVKRLLDYLKGRGTPYVELSEAKRALFAGVRLPSFVVVAYSTGGPNLLVTCRGFGEDGGRVRENMRRWQEIFGEGFAAARAVVRRGEIRFLDLDGKECML